MGILEQDGSRSWWLVCLTAAEAFRKLQKCHSIILASGTLEPLQAWQAELDVEFRHRLKEPGYITQQHVRCGVASSIMPGQRFDWSFGKQSHESLNMLLRDAAAVIPNGIVACFASYRLMN
jgi:Rad3-related DNA helicase